MKDVPAPSKLQPRYVAENPEELAVALDYKIVREEEQPQITGIIVYSEFRPPNEIILYLSSLKNIASELDSPLWQIEQWHIAHELYHGLAAAQGEGTWNSSELAADTWADELFQLMFSKKINGAFRLLL